MTSFPSWSKVDVYRHCHHRTGKLLKNVPHTSEAGSSDLAIGFLHNIQYPYRVR